MLNEIGVPKYKIMLGGDEGFWIVISKTETGGALA